jgi:hypothetical protein
VNDRIHAGMAVLSATFVVATLAVRWAVTPVREPASYWDGDITVEDTPLVDLMGEWEPVYGVALEQARGDRT